MQRNDAKKTNGVIDMRFITKNLALAALVSGLTACFGGAADIDRTQSHKVEKSIFEGEWFFRPTVIEVQYGQGMLFEGLEGTTERIRWDIRENKLVAYRSYETLIGAEEGNGEVEFRGAPVARFAIIDQFDIIREYNKATGQQRNTLVEDKTERPWWERDYIRVDWSVNLLADNYSLEDYVQAVSGPKFYRTEEEIDSPYRPEINHENINIVTNYILEPHSYFCESLYAYEMGFCSNTDAKMKLSFVKVEGNRTTEDGNVINDYEPMYHPDIIPVLSDPDENGKRTPVDRACYTDGTCERHTIEVFERFGYFRHQRLAYDDEFGWTRDGRVYLGHRHNIWRRSHDANGELIEPAFRDPGKVIYYTNVDFPEDNDIWSATYRIAADWDLAFRQTVAGVKRKYDPDITADDILKQYGPIFEVRENTCNITNVNNFASKYELTDELDAVGITEVLKGNLKRACAVLEFYTAGTDHAFTWEKFGDLRYSFFNWVDRPQAAGPLGYGPSSPDPITGEIIAGTANIYGAAIDTFAAYAADVVTLMNSTSADDFNELVSGQTVRDHIEQSRMRANQMISDAKLGTFDQQQFEQREALFHGRVPKVLSSMYDMKRLVSRKASDIEIDGERAIMAASGDQMRKLIGTPLEKELLINDEMRRAMQGPSMFQPGQASDSESDFSPIEFMTGGSGDRFEEARMALARHSIMMADLSDFNDVGMASLAKDFEQSDWQEVYSFMRREIYRGVMAHEIGHTVGLRHNFSSSFDAMNYDPRFWESFDVNTGKVEYGTADAPTSADRYQYASIMDYDARFYADSLQGIGAYDRAAIKFGYGNLIEVFDSSKIAFYFDTLAWYHGYHNFPALAGGGDMVPCDSNGSCVQDAQGNLTPAGQALIDWSNSSNQASDLEDQAEVALQDGDYDAWAQLTHDASIANDLSRRNINTYLRDVVSEMTVTEPCTEANKWCGIWDRSEITLDELQQRWTDYYMGRGYNIPDVVPYDFCPDELAGWSWVRCKPYDKGATYREVTQDRMNRYDSYYFFSNFKRDRANFGSINSYVSRLFSRFLEPMSNVFRYVMYTQGDMGLDKAGNIVTLADFPVGRDWQIAGIEGLNFLTQIIEQPEPGGYCLEEQSEFRLLETGQACGDLVGVGQTWDGVVNDYCRDATTNEFEPLGVGVPCTTEIRSYCSIVDRVYRPTTDTLNCVILPGETEAKSMNIEPGVGKYIHSTWTNEYNYKPTRIGTFYDKYAALHAMTANEGFFYRDFSSYFDYGASQLSYWSGGLQTQMLELFKTAFNGGTGKFAWRYEAAANGNGGVTKPTPVIDIYVDPPGYDLPRIEASTTYTLQWYGVVLPMARFNSSYDYTADFMNYSRICLDGYIDCMDFADLQGGQTGYVDYVDPLTGYRYIAAKTDMPESAVAPRILQAAEEFKLREFLPAKRVYLTALAPYEAALAAWEADEDNTALRYAYEATLPAYSDAKLRYERAEAELNRTTSFLDITRDWGGVFGGAWR